MKLFTVWYEFDGRVWQTAFTGHCAKCVRVAFARLYPDCAVTDIAEIPANPPCECGQHIRP